MTSKTGLSHWGHGMALAAAVYVAVLTMWLVTQPMPPLQDYGEWLFQSWAMLGLLRGNAVMHAQFAAAWFPVPNLMAQWLLVAADTVMGPLVAAKVLVAVYCVGATAVCALAARRFRPQNRSATFVVLLALVAFNSCFWHGYANYQLGLVLFVLFVERTWARETPAAAFAGWALLFYACHGSILIAFFVWTAVFMGRRWQVWLAVAPAAALFAVYLLRRVHAAPVAAHTVSVGLLMSHLAYKGYTLVKTGPYQNLVDAHGVSAMVQPAAYRTGVALNIVFGAVLGGMLLWAVCRRRASIPRGLLVFVATLFVLVLVLPADVAEVVNLGERFLYVLLVTLVLLLPGPLSMRALSGLCLAGFALTAAQLPRCSLSGPGAPEAFHRPPEVEGRAYRGDGLLSHRLYQNDERRVEIRDGARTFAPLLFDTWMLKERSR